MKKSLINTKMLIGLSVALIMSSAGLMVYGQGNTTPTYNSCIRCPYNVNSQIDCNNTNGCERINGACCQTALIPNDNLQTLQNLCRDAECNQTDKGCSSNNCPIGCYLNGKLCYEKCPRPRPENSTLYYGNGIIQSGPSSESFTFMWYHNGLLDGMENDYVEVPKDEALACSFGCKKGFYYDLNEDSCVSSACNGEPVENSVVVRDSINPHKLPISGTYHYVSDPNSEEGCSFTCKSGYERNNNKCEKIETQPQKWFYQFMNIDKLTIGIWNSIMEKLDEILTRSDDGVPSGAIMAFALDECPSGWRRFGEADGRFLRGASSYGATGGNSEIKLNANQLPAHQHVYKDTVYSEDFKGSSSYINLGNTDIPGGGQILGNAGSTDENNYPVYGYRATVNGICTGKSSSQLLNGSSCSTTQKTIDITNPYLNVIYCVKQ